MQGLLRHLKCYALHSLTVSPIEALAELCVRAVLADCTKTAAAAFVEALSDLSKIDAAPPGTACLLMYNTYCCHVCQAICWADATAQCTSE